MIRTMLAAGLLLWMGTTLLLADVRWFARPALAERLRPYVPGGMGRPGRSGVLSVESFAEIVGPLARAVGERLARVLGVGEDVEVRLRRVHSPLDVTAFRVRQLGWSVAGFGGAGLVVAAAGPSAPVALLLLAGGPLLAFLVSEQRLALASERWQRRVFLELPVVVEQLAMLLSAGYSLSGAINRVGARGAGACATDLARVGSRVRQGLTEAQALDEWAQLAGVEALDRVVPVMALGREASDLGRLLGEEARAVRRDVHRELVETMERRSQQVWIPVTVATLVPGVIFMLIPFVEAVQFFAE